MHNEHRIDERIEITETLYLCTFLRCTLVATKPVTAHKCGFFDCTYEGAGWHEEGNMKSFCVENLYDDTGYKENITFYGIA